MATRTPTQPLDSLQFILNDLIVQVGKALRASTKQPGRRDVAVVQAILQNHIPSNIQGFHNTLDNMENDIIQAKSVLRRDLEHLEAQSLSYASRVVSTEAGNSTRPPLGSVTRMEVAQTPESSSPLAQLSHQALPNLSAPTAPMAPVPDMGGQMAPVDVHVKHELQAPAPQAIMEPTKEPGPSADVKPAPVPEPLALHAAPEAPMDDLFSIGDGTATVGNTSGEFNFTDITFSLAPGNGESQDQARTRQSEMDLSAFGNEDMSSLDNMLPADTLVPPTAGLGGVLSNTAAKTSIDKIQEGDKANGDKVNGDTSDNLDDMFTLGGDGGMDLDMNLGGGDSSNFDSMFFTELEDVKYDDAFFNIGE